MHLRSLLMGVVSSCCISFVAQAGETAQLNIRLDAQGRPVTDLTIANHKVPVVIDTGSNTGLHLTKEVMAMVPGLKLTGKKIRSLDLAGKVRESEEFIVPDFVANGVHFGTVRGEALIPWGLSLGKSKKVEKPISVIGLPLFDRTPMIYDLQARRLQFGALDVIVASGAEWKNLPFEKINEGLAAKFSSATQTYRLILDSAANSSVMKQSRVQANQEMTETCDFDLGPGRECRRLDLQLQSDERNANAIKPIVSALLIDLPEQFTADGIVGSDFFQHYVLFVDIAKKQVALKASAKK